MPMSDEIFEVATHSVDVAALGQDYSDRVDGERILLGLSSEVAVGDEVRFVVLLLDGTAAFAGAGRCVQVSDQGEEAGLARFETLLDALAFDERSLPVYEYIVAVRQLAYQQSGYEEETGAAAGYEEAAPAEAELDVAVGTSSAPPSGEAYAADYAQSEASSTETDPQPAYEAATSDAEYHDAGSHEAAAHAYEEDAAAYGAGDVDASAEYAAGDEASEPGDRPTALEVTASSLPRPIPAPSEPATEMQLAEATSASEPPLVAARSAEHGEDDEPSVSYAAAELAPEEAAEVERVERVESAPAAAPARAQRAPHASQDAAVRVAREIERNDGLALAEAPRARPEPRVYTTIAPEPLRTGILTRPALAAHWAPAAPRPPQRSLRPTGFQAYQGPLAVPEVPPRPELDRSQWVERAPGPA
jgi:hypothetical protein